MLSALLFSTMEISLKLVSGQFNPIQLIFLRFLIGSLMLSPLAVRSLKKREIKLNRNDFAFFFLTGFICVVVSMSFYQLSVLYCRASTVAILFSCNPLFVIPLAYFILKEKIYKHTVATIILSTAGIIFILNPMNMSDNAVGIAFSLFAAVTFALYSVIGKLKSSRYGSTVLNCFTFLMGSIEMLVFIALSKNVFISSLLIDKGFNVFVNIPAIGGISVSSLPALIYIGVFVTGLGYMFYFLAMDEVSASAASMVFFIKPAIAPVLSLIILHEPLAINTIIGIVLITIGSSVTFISNSAKNKLSAKTRTVI